MGQVIPASQLSSFEIYLYNYSQFEWFVKDGIQRLRNNFCLERLLIRIAEFRDQFDDNEWIRETIRVQRDHLLGSENWNNIIDLHDFWFLQYLQQQVSECSGCSTRASWEYHTCIRELRSESIAYHKGTVVSKPFHSRASIHSSR